MVAIAIVLWLRATYWEGVGARHDVLLLMDTNFVSAMVGNLKRLSI